MRNTSILMKGMVLSALTASAMTVPNSSAMTIRMRRAAGSDIGCLALKPGRNFVGKIL